MAEEVPTAEPTKKQQLPRPKWDYFLKNRRANLHDAVALSMNVRPARIDGLVSDKTAKISNVFRARLQAARLEMPAGGAIVVVEEGYEDDGSDWIVDLKSFVAFALARGWGQKIENFKLLGPGCSSNGSLENAAKKHKAPVAFVAALIQVLVQIATRAAEKGHEFDVKKMPGQKEDFYELARLLDIEFRSANGTLSTYMKNLCQFKGGRSSQPTDFYRDLFPELFDDRK